MGQLSRSTSLAGFCTSFVLIKVLWAKLCAWWHLYRAGDLEDRLGQQSEVLSDCAQGKKKDNRKMCRVYRVLVSAETSISLLIAGESWVVCPVTRSL